MLVSSEINNPPLKTLLSYICNNVILEENNDYFMLQVKTITRIIAMLFVRKIFFNMASVC